MTADGWRCPECGLILAPHVSEHRCDPPAAGVPAAPVIWSGPTGSGTAVTAMPPGTTITVTNSGTGMNLSSAQIRNLTGEIQRQLLRQARRNRAA